MKSILFTKPKNVTLACLRFMVEMGDEILGVVLYNKHLYTESPFVGYCEDKGIEVWDFKQADELFSRYHDQIEIIISNTFPKRIKESWICLAKRAAFNLHMAPLPEYRGTFGYNFALLNCEKEYGVSCHFLSKEFDTGDLIEVLRFPYDGENGSVQELVDLTDTYLYNLFCKTYMRFKSGERVTGTPQKEGRYYSRDDFEKAKQILSSDSSKTIIDKVRAFWYPPFEGAYIMVEGKKFFLIPQEEYNRIVQDRNGI